MTAELHAGFLAVAAIAAVAFALAILGRNPQSTPARLHALYGVTTAWWFVCAALLATGNGAQLWGRLAHLSIGMLPGIIFHLNVTTAGVAHEHRRGIRWHYAISALITAFSVAWPVIDAAPNNYSWGQYVSYSWLGIIPVGALAVVFAEVLWIYRRAVQQAERGSVIREKLLAFYQGNMIAALAMVDFVAAFGLGVYPFGFIVLTLMNAAALFGTVRFRLIEITPDFAAAQILETLPEAVIAVDSQHVVRLANSAASRLLGHERSELIDAPLVEAVRAPALLEALALPVSEPSTARELSFDGPDGEAYVMRITNRVLLDQRGGPVARVWVLHDLTAQRLAEAEKEMFEGWVRKSQRLESLGVLAGGIAHDFNNLLSVILGQADLALMRTNEGSAVDEELQAIIGASAHAEELTAQMLAYAGRSDASRNLIDLNAVTHEMGELLHVALSKKARLDFDLATDLPPVHANEGQMSQVILNLVTNASDALEDTPGVITLRTGFFDADSALGQGLESGEVHVFVEIHDTGMGMDTETKAHAFDPFYTTKVTGRGLGLATVFGIVQAHGGNVRVESEVGNGTCVTVALPAAAGEVAATPRSVPEPLRPSRSGLALLADDEPEVRVVIHQMLAAAGFEVVEAVNGEQAVAEVAARRDEISLVMLDVTMPEMDGVEALSEIRRISIDVPVIMMSGYAGTKSAEIKTDPKAWFLKKPFRAAELAAKLEEAAADSGTSL